MNRRFAVAAAVLSCWMLAPSRVNSAQDHPADAEPTALFEKAEQLLKARDYSGLRALAAAPESLAWTEQRTFRGQTNWNIHPLSLPDGSGWLAVFSDFHTCESIGDHIHSLIKTSQGWRLGPEIPETETRGYRVRDHKVQISYDLPRSGCKITDEVLIERTGATRQPCLLRLSSDMKVDSVSLDGRAFPVRSVPGLIAFSPPPARTFTLTMDYRGTVNHPGSDYIRPTEAVLVSYWYPHIGRLPARLGVTATVPRGWTVVGQGELVKRDDESDQSTFRFRNEIPTCYFSLDAGPYEITSRESGGRRLSVCRLKLPEDQAQKALNDLEASLTFYEKSFGPYPYSHYELVETLGPFGGALEAYSFSTYGQGTFGAVPHEVAHTWWGGIVPNPYTRTLWNESFASYSDGLFRRQTAAQKPPRALSGMHGDAQRGRGQVRGFAIPIAQAYDTSNGAQSAVGYGKGSIVLSMLEDILGTETMIRCMRRFREDHRAGDAADWADFQRAVRKTTGRDYAWFFEQWVDRGGLPVLQLADVTRTKTADGYEVTGEIRQEGTPYRLDVPLLLEVEGGDPVQATADLRGASARFRITSKTLPKRLALDPRGNLLIAGADIPNADPFAVVIP